MKLIIIRTLLCALAMCAIAALITILISDAAYASTSGTSFDGPLQTLRRIFTGPVAFTVSLLGIVVTGVTLIFGGEISDFAKRMVMVVLVISLVAFAAPILGQIFGTSGATVTL